MNSSQFTMIVELSNLQYKYNGLRGSLLFLLNEQAQQKREIIHFLYLKESMTAAQGCSRRDLLEKSY